MQVVDNLLKVKITNASQYILNYTIKIHFQLNIAIKIYLNLKIDANMKFFRKTARLSDHIVVKLVLFLFALIISIHFTNSFAFLIN